MIKWFYNFNHLLKNKYNYMGKKLKKNRRHMKKKTVKPICIEDNKPMIIQYNNYFNNVENLNLINNSIGCKIENSSKSARKSRDIFKTLFEYCFKLSMKTILTHLLIPTLVSLFHFF